MLIGADGINSAVREVLIGDGKPRYLNSMSWQTVIKCHQELYRFRLYRNDIDFLFLFFHLHSLRSLRFFYHFGATGIDITH